MLWLFFWAAMFVWCSEWKIPGNIGITKEIADSLIQTWNPNNIRIAANIMEEIKSDELEQFWWDELLKPNSLEYLDINNWIKVWWDNISTDIYHSKEWESATIKLSSWKILPIVEYTAIKINNWPYIIVHKWKVFIFDQWNKQYIESNKIIIKNRGLEYIDNSTFNSISELDVKSKIVTRDGFTYKLEQKNELVFYWEDSKWWFRVWKIIYTIIPYMYWKEFSDATRYNAILTTDWTIIFAEEWSIFPLSDDENHVFSYTNWKFNIWSKKNNWNSYIKNTSIYISTWSINWVSYQYDEQTETATINWKIVKKWETYKWIKYSWNGVFEMKDGGSEVKIDLQ